MSTETQKMKSAFEYFQSQQETLNDAKEKSAKESRQSTKYLRLSQDGTYTVRILPLAPVIDQDGNATMPRKGYEYPVKELVLKIKGQDNKGKEKTNFVNVCNAKYRFPELKEDLIDLYVRLACEIYADDEALCKKIKNSSFNGGLRYDSKRCMYIFDADKREDGIQILQLSYSQYKDLEDRKLDMWGKLIKKNPTVGCPISSIQDAYLLEIKRTTENKKTSYSFNIDNISGNDELTEEELQALLDAPRLPEIIYRYNRYHLEATIAFLEQYDEELGIDVMKEAEIKDCIDQIKLLFPADDTSHFNPNGRDNDGSQENTGNDLDSLWAAYDKLIEEGKDDKTEEGQDLRASIREFIEDNDLDIQITRRDTNEDLLNAIQEMMSDNDKKGDEEKEPEKEKEEEPAAPARRVRREEPKEEAGDNENEPASPRRERNDDTNEPAAARRSARPTRRR